jgi:hypothetical protein
MNYVYAAVHLDDRTADDDLSLVILIIVVGTALINIGLATVLLGLSGRQATVTPSRLLSFTPSRGMIVTIAVDTVLVFATLFPSPIVIAWALRCVRIFFYLALPIVRCQSWCYQT